MKEEVVKEVMNRIGVRDKQKEAMEKMKRMEEQSKENNEQYINIRNKLKKVEGGFKKIENWMHAQYRLLESIKGIVQKNMEDVKITNNSLQNINQMIGGLQKMVMKLWERYRG